MKNKPPGNRGVGACFRGIGGKPLLEVARVYIDLGKKCWGFLPLEARPTQPSPDDRAVLWAKGIKTGDRKQKHGNP